VKPNFIHLILVGLVLVVSMMFAPLASLGQSVTGTPESASSQRTVGTTAGAPAQASSSPAPIYSFSLGYGPNANIIAAQDSLNGNWSYSYDEFNRLLTASGNGQGQSFDYDVYGNRWHENVTLGQAPSTQFIFDNSNRIIASGVKYDALGNVIDDGFHKYTYDAENRLIKVDLNPDGSSAASYTYDAFGQRVSKTAASAAMEFLYDLAGRVIAERDSTTGAWNRSEVYAGARHLATYALNTTYFRHSDWLGSSRVKTLPDGTVAETCTNLPFGDGLTCTPGAGQSASPDLFAGYERDQETQLDHTWFRKYSSAQGRWTTPDPYLGSIDLANPQSLNRYAYVLNNPVNLRDPLGLADCVYYADDDNHIEEIDSESSEKECQENGGAWFPNGFPTDGSIDVHGNVPTVPVFPMPDIPSPTLPGFDGGGGAGGKTSAGLALLPMCQNLKLPSKGVVSPAGAAFLAGGGIGRSIARGESPFPSLWEASGIAWALYFDPRLAVVFTATGIVVGHDLEVSRSDGTRAWMPGGRAFTNPFRIGVGAAKVVESSHPGCGLTDNCPNICMGQR
jgi:RHS repeat-associated protein